MPGTGGQLTPTNKHLCPCGDDILGEDTVRLMIGLMRHFQIEVCAGKAVKIGGLTEPGLANSFCKDNKYFRLCGT